MRRRNRPHVLQQHNESVHRWTVSYADYMTLMFALFVVLYAVLLNKKDDYKQVIEAIQTATEFVPETVKPSQQSDVLLKQSNDIQVSSGPALLSEQKKTKNNLDSITENGINEHSTPVAEFKKESSKHEFDSFDNENKALSLLRLSLNSALKDELMTEGFSVDLNGEWLTINMSGPLLFAAGSHTLLNGASETIKKIGDVLKPINNMIRLRGYTDTNTISDEIYKSNWELSAMRAMSVLHALNKSGIVGERFVVESFGKYSPIRDKSGKVDEFKSRRVVIAISKFSLLRDNKAKNNVKVKAQVEKAEISKPDSDDIQEIYLPDGRLIITTRQEQP